ncbi:hypothetical protein ACQKKX_18715 [Neorhizobium sp. NPDC001467]|uniref:hypothetical protein n=1 Tax=Neorhizobium sp. NPDC001467 TaxID=3390595 RepID=UPI003D015C6C
MAFLMENPALVSSFASVATLIVWVTYLQLFYRTYRHQLVPKVMIARAGGQSLSAQCMLTNLSPEFVYIQAIIVRLRIGDETVECSLSDREAGLREGVDPRSEFLQGPLASGEYLRLRSFEDMARGSLRENGMEERIGDLDELAVTAVGTYTWNNQTMAAERVYQVRRRDGRSDLVAEGLMARQIRSRRELKRLVRFLEERSCRVLSPQPSENRLGNGAGTAT